jgi:predicted ATP-grasp superfamily ATP-dependent carboligase
MTSGPGAGAPRIPVVLLGHGVQGLDVARSLGRRGIKVIAVDWRRGWEAHSRYIAATLRPPRATDDELLRLLTGLGDRLGGRPLLMPMDDDFVLLASRRRDDLARSYRLVLPDAAIVEALVSKRGLWSLCQGNGVALPATYHPTCVAELERLAGDLPYPCIIKPSFSRDWLRSRPPMLGAAQKVIEVASPAQLLEMGAALGDRYGEIVVQEVIPGPDANLYYVAAYLDQRSRPLAAFVGRKLRTCPPHFGNGTYVESVHAPGAAELAVGLLSKLGYRGCAGVEFKLDPRDGQFKLIEINARFGLWDGFAAACGVDLAYIAYADATGLPLPPERRYRAGVCWVQPDRDLWTMLDYRRAGELSFASGIRSLLRCRVFAPAAWDDPLPWVALNLAFARGVAQAAWRRLTA